MREPTLPVTFCVPKGASDIVREWALGLRDYGGRAGTNFSTPSKLGEDLVDIKVSVPRGPKFYLSGLRCLTLVDMWCLRAARKRLLNNGRPYRPVYEAICYVREPRGQERWLSLEALHRQGWGDCEDLACARSAERNSVGDTCRPDLLKQVRRDGSTLYHVIVRNPDGSIEDPSEQLGMVEDKRPTHCAGMPKVEKVR